MPMLYSHRNRWVRNQNYHFPNIFLSSYQNLILSVDACYTMNRLKVVSELIIFSVKRKATYKLFRCAQFKLHTFSLACSVYPARSGIATDEMIAIIAITIIISTNENAL